MADKRSHFLGIDVGGTKIQVSVASRTGTVSHRYRTPSPRDASPDATVQAIIDAIRTALDEAERKIEEIAGIGIAVPGVVDPAAGLVVMTPNMSLSGVSIGPRLEKEFGVPIALGNDCNVGALGEAWLGSARGTESSISILVGTGVGSGIIQHGQLWRGSRGQAGEIGHIVMEIGGPTCGCGNKGCLEALASRTAMEREIRAAVERGEKTVLLELLEGDLNLIRSGALRRALEAGDEVVTRVMRKACEVIGHGCLTVRHLVDPEVIVLGGGVVEACGNFMLPIIQDIINDDKLVGAKESRPVAIAALGDDAVVVGAVALVRNKMGDSPFGKPLPAPKTADITADEFGLVRVGKKEFDRDVIVRVNGQIKKRKKDKARELYGSSHVVGADEVARICKGGPEIVFIGAGHDRQIQLNEDAIRFLEQRRIDYKILPTNDAAKAYNKCDQRKAALIHVTC